MADQTTPPAGTPSPPRLPPHRTEPLAIWSLVLAALSYFGCLIFTAIPAIICGHRARSKIRRSNGALHGMGIALAGLIVAYIEIPFAVLGGVMLVDMIRSERGRLHGAHVAENGKFIGHAIRFKNDQWTSCVAR
jgi:hypothetical protein